MTKELPKHLADANLTYVSHSQLEKPACLRIFEYLYLKDERRDIPVGVPATAGGAAHDAIQAVVCDGLDIDEAIAIACKRIQEHQPISELDDLKRIQYIEDVEHIVRIGVEELGKLGDIVFTAEERISLQHPKLAQEVMGYVDLTGEKVLVELKTKWNPLGPPRKDGSRSFRKVKTPTRPDPSHVRQVAIYWAATGKMPYLVYINTEGAVTFSHENCDLLTVESLSHHFNQILHNAVVWENLLTISTDPQVLKYWVQPNWDDFRWRFMPDNYLQQARELFKI